MRQYEKGEHGFKMDFPGHLKTTVIKQNYLLKGQSQAIDDETKNHFKKIKVWLKCSTGPGEFLSPIFI